MAHLMLRFRASRTNQTKVNSLKSHKITQFASINCELLRNVLHVACRKLIINARKQDDPKLGLSFQINLFRVIWTASNISRIKRKH